MYILKSTHAKAKKKLALAKNICKLSCNAHNKISKWLNILCRGSEIADTLSGILKSALREKKTAIKFEPGDN